MDNERELTRDLIEDGSHEDEFPKNVDSGLSMYFEECAKYEPLTREQEREIAREIRDKRRDYLLSLLKIPYTWERVVDRKPITIKKSRSNKNPEFRDFDYERWRVLYETNKGTIEKLLERNKQDFEEYHQTRSRKIKRRIIERIKRRIESGARLVYEMQLDAVDLHELERMLREEEIQPVKRKAYVLLGVPFMHDGDSSSALVSLVERCMEDIRRKGEEYARAIEKLVNPNLRLAVKIAKKWREKSFAKDVPLLDLIQEGNLGLIVAAERFNPDANSKFSTYATFWIKQAVNRALSQKRSGMAVRVPVYKRDELTRLAKEVNFLIGAGKFSVEELAKLNGRSMEEVEGDLRLLEKVCSSLDQPIREEGDSPISSLIPDNKASRPDEEAEKKILIGIIGELMDDLTEEEREVIMARFGVFGYGEHTLEEYGKKIGRTREAVRQRELKALEKLRRMVRRRLREI